MFRTIRSKFIFLAITIIIAGVVIGNVLIINQLRENFHKQTALMLSTTLDIFRDGLNNEMMMSKSKNIQRILNELSKNDHIDHIRLINPDGIINFASNLNEKNKNISEISPSHVNINEIKKRSENRLFTATHCNIST